MSYKDWPYWLKGAVISGVVHIIAIVILSIYGYLILSLSGNFEEYLDLQLMMWIGFWIILLIPLIIVGAAYSKYKSKRAIWITISLYLALIIIGMVSHFFIAYY